MGRTGNTQFHTCKCVHMSETTNEELFYGAKSTVRPRICFVIITGILFVSLFAVTIQLMKLSFEYEELKQQTQTDHELLQKIIKTQKAPAETPEKLNAAPPQTMLNDNSEVTGDTDVLSRSKRSKSKRWIAHKRNPILCHLEGRPGPNAPNTKNRAEQYPASIHQSILWKTDNVPYSYCFMETERDDGNNGIQYIKITRDGFYKVYAQLTYDVGTDTPTGHSIDVSRSEGPRETILRTLAPWQSTSLPKVGRPTERESKYTSGIFHLRPGDRLSVHPLQPGHLFVMTEVESFFGAVYIGGRP